MKLWTGFTKELKIALRGFYFYIEIFMAVIILAVLLFALPEKFEPKSTEYLYFDTPEAVSEVMLSEIAKDDLDGKPESVEIKIKKDVYTADLYITDERKIYIVDNKEDMIKLADAKRTLGAAIEMKDNKPFYTYYLQGYESEKLRNLYKSLHAEDFNTILEALESQDIRPISTDYDILTDRQNVLPTVLVFNGSLMGIFIIAAYIFLDKKEGVIKALAVTSAPVWQYLMSKVLIVTLTSLISAVIVVVPIMGMKPDYLMLILLLLTTGFFASSLGLLIGSYFKNLMQAFGIIYFIIIAIMVPNIAYFIPSWEPGWVKFIPSYPMIHGFKETFLVNGDKEYVLIASIAFLAAGLLLFIWSNIRYRKTLTM
jgi:ABC-2 type transport system permease protein